MELCDSDLFTLLVNEDISDLEFCKPVFKKAVTKVVKGINVMHS